MLSHDDELFAALGRALGDRHGWHLEPSTTPGGSPSWCLDPGGEVVLSASVVQGRIQLYLPAEDREIEVGAVADLQSWLDGNEAGYLAD
ncbi:MAG: hypothetical protein ABSF84_05620 [Acidimicrobiales bacterium]|jgi:hypothetical protein